MGPVNEFSQRILVFQGYVLDYLKDEMALCVGFATKQSGGGVSMLGYKLNLSGRELVITETG